MPRQALTAGLTGDARPRSPITQPGYRAGERPPNFGKRYPAEVLTPEEVSRLLTAFPRHGASGTRNRALVVVLWRGGLRIQEALSLYPKDVNLQAGTVTVLHGKRDRSRTIGLDPQAVAVLERWIDVRRELGISGQSRLFCTIAEPVKGGPMHPSNARKTFSYFANKAGIEKRVHPHGLRHTHAYELANEGTPLHLIQAQLGHNSLATTDRYVRHIAPVALVKAMHARTWPIASIVDSTGALSTPGATTQTGDVMPG
jgi:site-specific recombinase XerD